MIDDYDWSDAGMSTWKEQLEAEIAKLNARIAELDEQLLDASAERNSMQRLYGVANAGWARECEDVDKVLSALGVDLGSARTDGGSLNIGRVVAALKAPQPSGGVVLPERKGLHVHHDSIMPTYSMAWNACLDEVSRLNTCRVQAVPDGFREAQVVGFKPGMGEVTLYVGRLPDWLDMGHACYVSAALKAGQSDQDGCNCQGCGGRYTADLLVPDDAWEKIKPEGKAQGAGLLCPNCIMSRLMDIGWSAGHLSPQSDAGQRAPIAYRWAWKESREDDGWTYRETLPSNPNACIIQPLYTTPPTSADAVSVPRELLEELIDAAEYGTGINNSELMQARALLAQSESKGVKL